MKVETVKEKLIQAIGKAEKMSGKNLNLPILSCVLIEAKKSSLIIRATNLDIGIEVVVPARIETEGTVAVSGSVLNAFLTHVKNEKNVTLEVVDGNLSIKTGSLKTTIKAQPHDDFPTLPKASAEKSMVINPGIFVKGLKSVYFAASISSVKPELASVYVYPGDNELVFVSTDSFRLAEKKIKFKDAKDFPSTIIPAKNIGDIIRTLEDVDEDVEIHFDKTQIAFKATGMYLVSRVIDGTFPDYKQIIPKSFSTEIIALKTDVIDAFKASNIFSDKFNQLNIKSNPKEKIFQIRTKNNDVGEYASKIDSSLTGDELDVNFNHRYVSDCFSSIDSDSISFSFNGLAKPLVVQGVSDKSFFYLVMPMNK